MLLARAVPWGSLVEAMRYEGVPPLFHVLLKIAGAVLPNPLALVLVGALGLGVLLAGTYRLLVSLSGAPRSAARVTLALSFTYVYVYELGVVVRPYTLGLGLSLLSFALLRDALGTAAHRRRVHAGALAGGLAALSSAHAACVAGGGLLAFGVLCLANRRPLRTWWSILLTLPAFGFVAYLASPFPHRIAKANAIVRASPMGIVRLSVQALITSVMPDDWWRIDTLLPPPFFDVLAFLRSLAFWGLLAGVAVALGARAAFLRSRWRVEAFDVFAVLASWPPLLEIIVRHYWGSYRHHLFLGMPLVVILSGWGLDARFSGELAAEARRAGRALLVPWFVLQTILGATSLALDFVYPFSDTKSAARVPAEGAHVVAESEWKTLGVLFWRPDLHMRARAWRGQPYRYLRADDAWDKKVALPPLVVEECGAAPDRVYFAGTRQQLGALAKCAHPVAYPKSPLGNHPQMWESSDLSRMDCGCVAASAAPGR
jgi:hypothetical protein